MRMSRHLDFEALGSRLALSASPTLVDTAEGEGETFVMQQVGDRLFVIGNDADNLIDIVLGEQSHVLTVDGEQHEFAADEVREFLLAGRRGNDEIQVLATGQDDRVVIDGDEAVLQSDTYRVLVEDTEIVRLLGNTGDDRAVIHDSSGDDELHLHSTFATFVADGRVTMRVSGFERVEAFAEAGGADLANFYDSAEDDRFVAKPGFSYMVGTTFWNYAKGFEHVEGFYRTGGNDQALFYDSPGDDRLTATPTEVVFLVDQVTLTAHDFPVTRTFASTGNDTGTLTGQDFVADILVWDPESAFLRTTGIVDSSYAPTEVPQDLVPRIATNFAVGFDRLEALGVDPSDRAELKGSNDADQYVALPEIVELTTPFSTVEATNFGLVRAFGQGGDDHAHLQDSPADDRYYGKADFGFMSGPGFVNYVSGFKTDVVSIGGSDYVEVSEYSAPDDFLVFDDNQFMVFGPNRDERIIGFSNAIGFSDGAVVLALEPISHPFRLSGAHDNSQLPPEDTLNAIVARSDEPVESYLDLGGQIVPLSALEAVS